MEFDFESRVKWSSEAQLQSFFSLIYITHFFLAISLTIIVVINSINNRKQCASGLN